MNPLRGGRRGFFSVFIYPYVFLMALLKFGAGNAKLADSIQTFSLPAGYTCPGAKHCHVMSDRTTGKLIKGHNLLYECYAAKMEARYPNVRSARWHNKDLVDQLNLVDLTDRMILSIMSHKTYKKTDMVRWFVSGDCDSMKLRDAIFNVANELTHLIHYSYTKNLPLFLDIIKPINYRLTASYGGKYDHMINPVDFPRSARVVYSEQEAIDLNLPLDKKDDLAYGPIDQPFALLHH